MNPAWTVLLLEDGTFVGLSERHPELAYSAPTMQEAFEGIRRLASQRPTHIDALSAWLLERRANLP